MDDTMQPATREPAGKLIDETGSDELLPAEAHEEIERQLAQVRERDAAEEAELEATEPLEDPEDDPDTDPAP